jgi:TonB family protein
MLSLPKHLYRTVGHLNLVLTTAQRRYFGRLSMLVFLAVTSTQSHAQRHATQVYTYVEQMPQLPGGGGTQQIAAAIGKRLHLSGKIEQSCYRTMVYFEVSPTGAVQHVRIAAASQSPAVDTALLRAVRSLPTLRPGYQQGKPVRVSFTMPFRTATQ